MRTQLLGLATAALLSGTIAASAQGAPQGGAPNDQNQPRHAQHSGQPAQPGAHAGAQPGTGEQPGMHPEQGGQPGMHPGQGMQPEQNRGYEHTQVQGGEQFRERGAQPQGGEMLRGGEMRERGAPRPLTVEQRTNLRETVLLRGPRVTNINFRIGVGAFIPRSVRLVVVPQPILAIYPEWAGYYYFVYGDEIVVVAPDTMEIVGVLPLQI